MTAVKWTAAVVGMVVSLAAVLLAVGCSGGMSCHSQSAGPACHSAGSAPGPDSVRAASVVNTRCPIMGNKLDPARVPTNLTRQYKGQTIGFCCAGCPAKWDKLTEAEKDAGLSK